ncbi:MAG: FkbM family methyltransferase [Luteolibacter sp.]|uniref:FkbM family methyltransferase n=1 Tax=Luteolibacter sp. TaxID=1962973 RepID=UPI003262CCE5
MTFDTTSPWGTWKPRGAAAFSLKLIDLLPPSGIFRKLAFLLRKPVKNSEQAVYDREIWGLKLRLGARGNLTEQRWLTMANFHDAPERDALRGALHPGAVFLDVGANAGFYTFWALSQRHAGLRVIAVEPTEIMLERMRHNLAANNLTSSVTLFPCAVTPTPCEVVIEEHAGNVGQTAVRSEGSGRRVPGRPLLDLLMEAGVDRVDAMKIDIEGFEVPVLEAFFKTAPRTIWPRFVIGEIVGEGGEPLKNLLVSHGYRLDRCTKMNGILVLTE